MASSVPPAVKGATCRSEKNLPTFSDPGKFPAADHANGFVRRAGYSPPTFAGRIITIAGATSTFNQLPAAANKSYSTTVKLVSTTDKSTSTTDKSVPTAIQSILTIVERVSIGHVLLDCC